MEDDRTKALREQLDASDDPVERLQLHAELARATDPSRFEEAFVTHAKTWADEHGISAEAFEAEGVPRDVLRRAGLIRTRSTRGDGRRRPRRSRVSPDDIRAAIPGRGKKVTIKDIQSATGGSPATVRKVLSEMMAAGEVQELGPDPKHSGPGRAPMLYKRSPKR